ncbi:MAG: DUF5020 family protein [bacterium]
MKKALLFTLMATAIACGQEKNLFLNAQLHWDFDREVVTSTLEFFHLDRLGTTFFFADFDFDETGQHGSYFEIARNFRIVPTRRGTMNLSVQYNDGVNDGVGVLETPMKIIPGVFLYGVALDRFLLGKASFEFQALARKEFATRLSWQATLVWLAHLQPWLMFNGYVDVNADEQFDGRIRIQSEPQLKFLWRQWAIGSEVEVSRNFLPAGTERQPFEENKWFAHPTIFLQYNF